MGQPADAPGRPPLDPIAALLVGACVVGVTLQAVQTVDADTLFFLRYFTCLSAVVCALGCMSFLVWRFGAFLYLSGVVGVLCSGAGWWLMLSDNFSMVPRTVLEQASMYTLHVLVPFGAVAHVVFGLVPRPIPALAAIGTVLLPVTYAVCTLSAQAMFAARPPYGFLDLRRLEVAGGIQLAAAFCLAWLAVTAVVVRVQSARRRWELPEV